MEKYFRSASNQRVLTVAALAVMVVITGVIFWHSMGRRWHRLGQPIFIPIGIMAILFLSGRIRIELFWYEWVSYAMTLTLIAAACLVAWLYTRVVPKVLPGTTAVTS